jgi:hypothetical protein
MGNAIQGNRVSIKDMLGMAQDTHQFTPDRVTVEMVVPSRLDGVPEFRAFEIQQFPNRIV